MKKVGNSLTYYEELQNTSYNSIWNNITRGISKLVLQFVLFEALPYTDTPLMIRKQKQ